jgi:hypothetical protein
MALGRQGLLLLLLQQAMLGQSCLCLGAESAAGQHGPGWVQVLLLHLHLQWPGHCW